jgi:hypothetical protein
MQTFNKQNERRGGVLIELDPLNIVENISYPTIMPLNYGIPNQLWTCNGGLLKVFFCFSWLFNGLAKDFQVWQCKGMSFPSLYPSMAFSMGF